MMEYQEAEHEWSQIYETQNIFKKKKRFSKSAKRCQRNKQKGINPEDLENDPLA